MSNDEARRVARAVAKPSRSGRELVAKLREVGERTGWKDGVETDRVFSWDDFSKLRALLPLEIMSASSAAEAKR